MKKMKNIGARREGSLMKKGVIALLFATLAGSLTFGAAASLGIAANDLGAGVEAVLSCDADGVTVEWQAAAQVYEVQIHDVDNRCDGQELSFGVEGDLGPAYFLVTIPEDPTSTSVTVPTTNAAGHPINSWAITSVHMTITGEANL